MCPSFMATREEMHSTRGRANMLRLAMSGAARRGRPRRRWRLRDDGPVPGMPRLQGQCPVGVDVARFERGSWPTTGSVTARPCMPEALGNARSIAALGSRCAAVELDPGQRAGAATNRSGARDRPSSAPAAVHAHPADASRRRPFGRRRAPVRGHIRTATPTSASRRSRSWTPPASARRWHATAAAAGRRFPGTAGRRPRTGAAQRLCAVSGRDCRPAGRVLRAQLPLRRAGGRASAAQRRSQRARAAAVARRACCSRSAPQASARVCRCGPATARAAARPLPSEVDGARGAGRALLSRSRAPPWSIPTRAAAAWPDRSATTCGTTTRSRAPSASGNSSPPCAAVNLEP